MVWADNFKVITQIIIDKLIEVRNREMEVFEKTQDFMYEHEAMCHIIVQSDNVIEDMCEEK